MSPLLQLTQIPDIAEMLILMGVLGWIRKRYDNRGVDLWFLGLTLLLVETIAFAMLQSSRVPEAAMHALALDAYVLAAATFGWAARREMRHYVRPLSAFFLLAVPMLVVCTAYSVHVVNARFYLWLIWLVLLLGVAAGARMMRDSVKRGAVLVLGQCVFWTPMLRWAELHEWRKLVYWGLACLYLLVALSFTGRVRRGRIGGLVIVTGFAVWAVCFVLHPYARAVPYYNDALGQVWTMQKFLVTLGMLLELLEQQAEKLEREAVHDSLTGLPNRRLFDDRLTQALARCDRTGTTAAVFAMDLDRFKEINDTYGHRIGDQVLERVARALRRRLRVSDTIARCGGDEFNVIVSDVQLRSECEGIARMLSRAAAEAVLPPEVRLKVTASIGFALYPHDAKESGVLLELADMRMYAHKRGIPPEAAWAETPEGSAIALERGQ